MIFRISYIIELYKMTGVTYKNIHNSNEISSLVIRCETNKYQVRVCKMPVRYSFLTSFLKLNFVFDFCKSAVNLFHSNVPI